MVLIMLLIEIIDILIPEFLEFVMVIVIMIWMDMDTTKSLGIKGTDAS